jgi:SAM-dependent methyltransferase
MATYSISELRISFDIATAEAAIRTPRHAPESATGRLCPFCGTIGVPSETAAVRCNVRAFRSRFFAVWRCSECGSIHSSEDFDAPRFYADYPMRRQRYDGFARCTFRNQERLLQRAGLTRQRRILDYGCGGGLFVRYLRERGYDCTGYDPFSDVFGDRRVLDQRYDLVLAQDVVEHFEDPQAEIAQLKELVAQGGSLAIGTPRADHIDFKDPLDLAVLHQPYHRHIYSRRALVSALQRGGWEVPIQHEAWYVDTRIPFVNSAFLFRYLHSLGGDLEGGFEPVSPLHFLRHPSLLLYGFLGSWVAPRTAMLMIARRSEPGTRV